MALVINDRVKETSATTGTGTLSLAGAVTGFETFSSAIGNGNTTYYAIVNSNGEFEVGLGTVSAAALARTTVISSSNSDSAVNLSAGTKDVFVTLPASKAVVLDASGNIVANNGVNLTALNATALTSGTVDNARLPTPISDKVINATTPLTVKGDGSSADGKLILNCSQNSHGVKIKAPPHSAGATWEWILPVNDGTSGQVLTTDGNASAQLAWASPTTGDITGVTAGTNLTGGGTSGDVTINLADASTSAKGAASFSSDNFAASSGAITVKDAGIATAELQDNAVTTAKITDSNVTTAKIADANVTTAKILDNNVTTAKILDANVTTAKVADDAITLAKMASGTDGNIISFDTSGNPVAVATGNSGQVLTSAGAGAVPSFQTPTVGDITSVVAGTNLSGGGTSGDVTINLADASTSAKGAASFSSDNFAASSGAITIKDAGVATAEIQDSAVTTAKIADSNVTLAKMAANSVDSNQYVDGSIDTAHIANDQITNALMADNAIDTAQIAASAVETAKINDSAVTTAKITDGNVTAGKLASDSVITAKILDSNVTTAKVADNAITLGKMASGTDGNIISYDASGNPVAIATGSSGQVLTSAGAGAQPSFQTPTVGDITGVTAGSGLTGGGSSGSVTLNIGAGTGIDVSSDAIAVDVSDFMSNGSNNRVVTATGADAMNGEANMTFDGSTLVISGAITATGDITAFQSSDKTLKENISSIENAVDKVSKINGVYYNWTFEAQEKHKHFGKEKEVGVIAQDVEEVLPEIVQTRDDGTKAVKYERLCALLIESVKELKKEIEELKSGA